MRRFLLSTLLVLGCRPSIADLRPGELSVVWTGSADGTMRAVAAARFCHETRLVELIATVGDTGVGIALFPTDTLLPAESYGVFQPAELTEVRPGANVALRWFDVTRLDVFEATGGEVRIAATDGEHLSGSFDVYMRSILNSDTLHATGRFDQVPVVVAGADCETTSRRRRSAPLD